MQRNQPGTHQLGESNVQRPQSSIAHVNLGPNSTTYVVTERAAPQRQQSGLEMSNSASNDSNLSEQSPEHPDINVSVNPANNNNINDNDQDNDSHSDDGTQQVRVCTFF